ncbi:integrase core domain-containing protein [Streptomyces javensis]|uniref:integrase core domain-containing protein n=1 Tax=Streptomyces javensis TaxID=114698 RepID=UPI0031F97203
MIGSIRREALDHVLIMNEAHARHVLANYEKHYNEHRPHQARNQLPPNAPEQPPRHMTSTLTKSCVPGSSAVSSTSTGVGTMGVRPCVARQPRGRAPSWLPRYAGGRRRRRSRRLVRRHRRGAARHPM